eukprot:11059075-Ditylum_brightwellii.AAC.1
MCQVEKGKVVDWSKVKRNIRECAEMEGSITKSKKFLVLIFLKEDNWSLAFMCCCLVPSVSVNIASAETILTDKYVKVIKTVVDDL